MLTYHLANPIKIEIGVVDILFYKVISKIIFTFHSSAINLIERELL